MDRKSWHQVFAELPAELEQPCQACQRAMEQYYGLRRVDLPLPESPVEHSRSLSPQRTAKIVTTLTDEQDEAQPAAVEYAASGQLAPQPFTLVDLATQRPVRVKRRPRSPPPLSVPEPLLVAESEETPELWVEQQPLRRRRATQRPRPAPSQPALVRR